MVALDLLPPHGQVHCNVFVKLDNILVDMFDDSGRYYYVRLAEVYDLEVEHRIARDVAGHLGEFVPRPLAFFREQGLSCIVFEGVDFDVVSGKDLLAASPTRARSRPARVPGRQCAPPAVGRASGGSRPGAGLRGRALPRDRARGALA
jgi:hypothetical protein